MGAKRLQMRKLREILRLKYARRMGHRSIARACGVGVGTVSEYVRRARQAGLRWPLHCEGAMDASPVDLCLPNMKGVQSLVADLLKQEVQRQGTEKIVEKLQEQLPPDMQDKAKSLLKGLFGT